jgi:hypothetical protein
MRGLRARNSSIRRMEEITSPTDTACNQIDPRGVALGDGGGPPRRSLKCRA